VKIFLKFIYICKQEHKRIQFTPKIEIHIYYTVIGTFANSPRKINIEELIAWKFIR